MPAARTFTPLAPVDLVHAARQRRTCTDSQPIQVSRSVFRKVVEVNLIGTFNCIRLAAARMMTNPSDAALSRIRNPPIPNGRGAPSTWKPVGISNGGTPHIGGS